MKAQTIISIFLLLALAHLSSSSFAISGECTSGDCYDAVGTFHFPDDERYEGEWKDGRQHGVGTWFFPDGSKYNGQFKNGKYDGVGTFSWPDDAKYKGEWKDGRKNGVGILSFPDGSKFTGTFRNGKQGKGTWTFPDGGTRSSNKVGNFKLK